MMPTLRINQIFTRARSFLKPDAWNCFQHQAGAAEDPNALSELLECFPFSVDGPGFLVDLARLEWAVYQVGQQAVEPDPDPDDFMVNPGLQLLPLSFRNLPDQFGEPSEKIEPEPGETMVLVWKDYRTGGTRLRQARDEDLLALKIVLEEVPPETAAATGEIDLAAVKDLLNRAAAEGLLIAPHTRIRRDPSRFSGSEVADPEFLEAQFFTLQWHVTQVCDLHCKHCYDRSRRSPLTLEQGMAVLEDLQRFLPGEKSPGADQFQRGKSPCCIPALTSSTGPRPNGASGRRSSAIRLRRSVWRPYRQSRNPVFSR